VTACANNTTQSQAIIAGPQVFVSGQIPADTKGNLIEGSIADKTKQCCENIVGILTEAGVGIERVVKVNIHNNTYITTPFH
jgi:enamine deaminase RidA (YjgF/YER057c/UK114 family)